MLKRLVATACALLLLMGCVSALAEDRFVGFAVERKTQYVSFGNYPAEKNGDTAPVLWEVMEVMEDGTALLQAHHVLDAYPYIVVDESIKLKNYRGYRRISCFEESDLYPWMNSEMLNTMFTEEEQTVLDDSRGKIFILTRDEYLKTSYGYKNSVIGKISARMSTGTHYALMRGAYQQGGATYWTATLEGPDKTHAQIVGYDGHMSWGGYGRRNVGIRPAVLIKTAEVEFTSGSGTQKDPYIISLLQK